MSDGAIVAIVGAVVTIATLWMRMRYESKKVEDKVDANTGITKAGAASAIINAQTASNAALDAKEATEVLAENLNRKLNGGLDHAINTALEPIKKILEEYDRDRKEVRQTVETLKEQVKEHTEYAHRRNHDLLNSMSVQSNNVAVILELVKKLVQEPK